jgi:hypothetical protein
MQFTVFNRPDVIIQHFFMLYKGTWVGAAKWGKNFADITCRKGLKNIRKQIKTKKHLEQMLVPLIKKHLKEKPKQTPRVIMKVLVLVGQFPVVS